MLLKVEDLEKIQAAYPEYRMELVDGEIIVKSLSSFDSAETAAAFACILSNWVRPRKLGRVVGASAGFKLPNGDLRMIDLSFLRAEKLKQTTEDYAEIVPDLVVEVKSKTDNLEKSRAKIQQFIQLGSQIGILINPKTKTLEIYRQGELITLKNHDVLTLPDLLPGFEANIFELCPPVFE
ncbi:MAG TPA: Uma2 family endonuclease [Nostocaceae cyanobacterium]|nr:Uma2 family endonuclease [Nostocaceae cyanobacterium]